MQDYLELGISTTKFFIKLLALMLVFSNASAKTLDIVKERGFLQCGVSQSLPGFSYFGDDGKWTGLDIDICRAVAAAIFNDPNKVHFIPLSTDERFTALQSGEIDILSRNTTWTLTRDTSLGLDFVTIVYYDGQGFLINKKSKITNAKQLEGVTICSNAGTTSELNASDFFRTNNMKYKIITFEKDTEVIAAVDTGRCDVYTGDRSGLAAQRLKLSNPQDYIILPEIISKEPLGPMVRQGDSQWSDLIRWVIFGLVNAEEAGITKNNVEQSKQSLDPNVRRLLGVDQNYGKYLGLSQYFLQQAIIAVGNYGEIFERNLGAKTKLNLPRGLNNLWSKGGIMYAPPFR